MANPLVAVAYAWEVEGWGSCHMDRRWEFFTLGVPRRQPPWFCVPLPNITTGPGWVQVNVHVKVLTLLAQDPREVSALVTSLAVEVPPGWYGAYEPVTFKRICGCSQYVKAKGFIDNRMHGRYK